MCLLFLYLGLKISTIIRIRILVVAPGEATLDSNVLVAMSSIGAAKARAMKAGNASFDVDDFVVKLLNFMSDGNYDVGAEQTVPLDWEKIGRKAMAKSRRAPAMDFMCVSCLLSGIAIYLMWTCAGWVHYKLSKRSAWLGRERS